MQQQHKINKYSQFLLRLSLLQMQNLEVKDTNLKIKNTKTEIKKELKDSIKTVEKMKTLTCKIKSMDVFQMMMQSKLFKTFNK